MTGLSETPGFSEPLHRLFSCLDTQAWSCLFSCLINSGLTRRAQLTCQPTFTLSPWDGPLKQRPQAVLVHCGDAAVNFTTAKHLWLFCSEPGTEPVFYLMLWAGNLNAVWSSPCGTAPSPRAFMLLFVKGVQAQGPICGRPQGYSPLRGLFETQG